MDITDVLQTLDGGGVVREANDELAEVVEAVRESGKQGHITLKLKIKPEGKQRQVAVEPELKTKKSRPSKPAAFFYANEANRLSRKDPLQFEMPLNEVEAVEERPRELPGDE